MQNIVIEMPLDHYNRFLNQCDRTSRHYAILSAGAIIRQRKAGGFEHVVKIPCTLHEAKGLMDRATDVYPEVTSHIKDALAAARDS
jgi:hypothetical protein